MSNARLTGTAAPEALPLYTLADAEDYVAAASFRYGAPRQLGVELEWTVHHIADPRRPVEACHLRRALGPHTPPVLDPDSPHQPLPGGSLVTVEPGGQIEISSTPHDSLAALLATVTADIARLTDLLGAVGLRLGEHGTDPYRPPRRVLHTPRYLAMEHAFDRVGSAGRTMMYSTAGLQVCLDVGERDRAAIRWAAVHALGPVLLAVFANSPVLAGRRTGWASSRMALLYGTDPSRTHPASIGGDPAIRWARRAVRTPLLSVPRLGPQWDIPNGITFDQWIAGALPGHPTTADLAYHLSTLFPPVRPRGYLEVRYLDAQPAGEWILPVVAMAVLFRRESTVDAVMELAAPAVDRWVQAARRGLADPVLARVARGLNTLLGEVLGDAQLPPALEAEVAEGLERRFVPR
ncbi:MAG TPA: glutamate-cysteine ligase family protein [Pseudonocardiaceae bacterium]